MAGRMQQRRSVTTTTVPGAGDLNQGELFVNINPADKKMWVKLSDNSIFEIAGTSYALLASPAFTGTPTVPTATAGTNTTQAASTAFVQTAVSNSSAGLDPKQSVKAATAAALAANTASGSGVGKTLTADANGALSVDGVTGFTDIDNDGGSTDPNAESSTRASRVLVKDQGSADNGIYNVKAKGDGSNPWILIRATDADEDVEVSAGMFTFVEEGTTNADTGWVLTTNDDVTVDTTTMAFAQFTGAGSLTAGNGIDISANTVSVVSDSTGGANLATVVNVSANGVAVRIDDSTVGENGSNQLFVKNAGITETQLNTSVAGNGITGGGGTALAVQADSTGGANLATVVDVNANGVAIKIDDASIVENGSNQLEVGVVDGGVI
jgi:hypothetical protein